MATPKDEYAVVEIKCPWGILSCIAFVYSLPIRVWVRHLPWHPYHYWYRPQYVILTTLGLAVVGMLLAGIGMYRNRQDKVARWAMFLNGAVAGILIAAWIIGVIWWNFFR